MDIQKHFDRIKHLEDEIYREEIAIARKMPPGEKLMAGPRLFRRACEALKMRIREQEPDAEENRVLSLLRQTLNRAKRLEDLGCTVHLPGDSFGRIVFHRRV